MCYSGCRHENKNGGCSKGVNDVCPDKDLPECNNKTNLKCKYEINGYCTSEYACENKGDE